MLSTQEQLRYGRQIMLNTIGEEGQLALRNAKVLIVGLGGLGCPVSLYLAAAGIGQLFLCDGDHIEITNLQRQVLFDEQDIDQNKADVAAEKLKKLNHLVDIEVIDEMFDAELAQYYLPQVDLVIDCTDNMPTRYLLNQHCLLANVPLVIGAATGFDGQTMFIDPSSNTACYQCVFPDTQATQGENCQTLGILGPVLSIIGGMQALTAIKWLTGLPVNNNQLSLFDGLSQEWQHFNLSKQPDCIACSDLK